MERTLDWVPRYDERSRIYNVSQGVDYTKKSVYRWPPHQVLDQGREGACVGHGWAAAVASSPLKTKLPDLQQAAFGLYHLAQHLDKWEGEDYSGTSVLAGAKVCKEMGFIHSYNWAFNVNDIVTGLHEVGPVVIGIPWHKNMYKTDEHGIVQIGGEKVGGHCLMIYGYTARTRRFGGKKMSKFFSWRNSWSKNYGYRGNGYISWDNLQSLMDEGGEACIPRR